MSRSSLGLFVFGALTLLSAGAEKKLFTFEEPAMGTRFRVSLYASDPQSAQSAAAASFERVHALNHVFSDYLRESEVMRLCAAASGVPVKTSADLFSLLTQAHAISEASDGAFDITSGHLSHLWRRSRRQKELPSPSRLADALSKTNWRWVQLDPTKQSVALMRPELLLDLGGIAKGRAADEALKVLKAHGLKESIVIAGGDVAIGDPPPGHLGWEVRLKTSETADAAEVVLRLKNCGVSTSGDLHQFVEIGGTRYAHIVNPKTGLGLTTGIACSVIAPNATSSDALATAVCVMGEEKGLRMLATMPGHEARIVVPGTTGGQVVHSTPGFPSTEH